MVELQITVAHGCREHLESAFPGSPISRYRNLWLAIVATKRFPTDGWILTDSKRSWIHAEFAKIPQGFTKYHNQEPIRNEGKSND